MSHRKPTPEESKAALDLHRPPDQRSPTAPVLEAAAADLPVEVVRRLEAELEDHRRSILDFEDEGSSTPEDHPGDTDPGQNPSRRRRSEDDLQ